MPETAPAAPPLTWSRVFPATPAQAREARGFLADVLAGCPDADDTIVCLSELVTNALLHSRSREAGGTLTVRVCRVPGRLRVEVGDQGGPWRPRPPVPNGDGKHRGDGQHDGDAQHGRGLTIVGALSAGWGIAETEAGRTVWFEMT